MQLRIHTIHLPVKRPFSWRALWVLVALYFLGNLAGIPLLRATLAPIQPVWFWALVTAISAVLIGISLLINLNIDPTQFPASWQLVLASVKAGVVEDVFNRLFLVTVFVWLGRLAKREDDGRPAAVVYWGAIIAHFTYDAVFSALVMPAYLSNNLILWAAAGLGILLAFILSWRYLTRRA